MTIEKKDPSPKKVQVKFLSKGGQAPHELEDDMIHLTWDDGVGRQYVFHYPGKKGWMMIPFPEVFVEPGHVGDKNQFYLLKGGAPLTLTLKRQDDIKHLPTDGAVTCGLALFDEELQTFAVKNSPPPIKLGP